MNFHIAVIPGDGIGPEIVTEAKKVLDKVGEVYGHSFEYEELMMGGCSIDAYGEPLTKETLESEEERFCPARGSWRQCGAWKLVYASTG